MQGRENVYPLPPQQPAIEPFQPTYISELQGRTPPEIDWVVSGMIPRGACTLLAGDSDLGKSYIALQLITAAALGQPWLGRETTQCRTFGLFAEDSERVLHIRQERISAHYGIEHADLEMEASWLSKDGGDATLMSFGRFDQQGAPTLFWHQLVSYLLDTCVRLVVLDTVARVFSGNENDRAQTTAFLRLMTSLAVQIDGAVILTAHPPKDNMNWYSGSGAWKASARSAMSLERPKGYDEEHGIKADERVLRVRKGNYSGARPVIPLRWHQDGVWVAEEAHQRKQSLSTQERHDLDYRMLAGLKRACANGSKIPADPSAPGSLPRRAKGSTPEWREWPLVWLADSVDRLIDAGMVIRVEIGNRVCVRPTEANPLPGEREWKVI